MSEPQLATMLSAAEIVKRADRRFFSSTRNDLEGNRDYFCLRTHNESSESQLAFLLLRCTLVARPFCKLDFQEVYGLHYERSMSMPVNSKELGFLPKNNDVEKKPKRRIYF